MSKPELKSKLEKSLEILKEELARIRTGRASPALLETVKVNAYDTKMSVKELGSISVADPQNLVVSPWDKTLVNEIAKGIREAELNLNPVVDGEIVRVPVPDLTEERRRELAKTVSVKVEETKTSVRNVRQEAMKDIENQFTNKQIGEDDKFRLKEETEDLVKEFTKKAEDLGEQKSNDLLKI